MKTKSLSIFLVALFVVEMNLGAEEDNNKDKEGENFKYEKMGDEHASEADFGLRTILIGNSNVGKSALITKICKNTFSEVYTQTIGVEFFNLNFNIVSDIENKVLRYQILDFCGGQKIYKSLLQNFYKNARVCLLAYDVTDEKSFNDINGWLEEVKKENPKGIEHFVLIGNKIDLDNNRKITKEEGEKFAEENGMKFVEVSAKTGVGIKDLENILAKIIYEEFMKYKKEKEVEEEKKEEDDSEDDFIEGEKPTRSSFLCDCCKKICENC